MVLVSLPLVAISVWWLSWVLPHQQTETLGGGPIFVLVNSLFGSSDNLKNILTIVLVIIEAILANNIAQRQSFFQRHNHLVALMFVVLSGLFISQLSFNPIILANAFVILAFSRMTAIYRQQSAMSQMFDAGLFLSLAVLCFTPIVFAVPILFITLLVIRPLVWREWLMGVIGLLMPVLYLIISYYVFSFQVTNVWLVFDGFNLQNMIKTVTPTEWLLVLTLFIIFLISIYHFYIMRLHSVTRIRKLTLNLMLLLGFLTISYLCSCFTVNTPCQFGLFVFPLSFLLSYPLYYSKKTIIIKILYYVFLLEIGINYFLLF